MANMVSGQESSVTTKTSYHTASPIKASVCAEKMTKIQLPPPFRHAGDRYPRLRLAPHQDSAADPLPAEQTMLLKLAVDDGIRGPAPATAPGWRRKRCGNRCWAAGRPPAAPPRPATDIPRTAPPCTAPPIKNAAPPEPWSLPVPLSLMRRPNSENTSTAASSSRPVRFQIIHQAAHRPGHVVPQRGVSGQLAGVGVEAAVLRVIDARAQIRQEHLRDALDVFRQRVAAILNIGRILRRRRAQDVRPRIGVLPRSCPAATAPDPVPPRCRTSAQRLPK